MSEEIKNEQVEVEVEQTEEKVESKTFSQDEVNELIEKRLQRERKKLDKFADYDDLKAQLEELRKVDDERKRADMSELEKLQADLQAKAEREQELAKQLEEVKTQAQREKIVNAFIKAAPGVNIPADRIDAALKLADLSAVQVEDSEVSGLEDVLSTLVEQYSFLAEVKKPQKPVGESSNGNAEASDKTAEQLLKDAAEKAKRTGKIEDRMAVAALKRELGL